MSEHSRDKLRKDEVEKTNEAIKRLNDSSRIKSRVKVNKEKVNASVPEASVEEPRKIASPNNKEVNP